MASFRRSGIPEVQELKRDASFQQILELDFNDMIPFVISNISKPGLYSRLYMAVNAITLAGLVIGVVWAFSQGWLTWTGLIKQFITGVFAGSILVIPFHELFHGLAYRILGARKIKFGADLQQFIFFVSADRFPVAGMELYFLALLPFALINALTIGVIIIWMPHIIIFCGFFLLSHNLMCIGDFAIVNYTRNEKGEIFSYDEIEKKKSYFYKKVDGNLM
ncbi:MAG: DUF3267 domain-containing protein [Bacteroidota bacterium]